MSCAAACRAVARHGTVEIAEVALVRRVFGVCLRLTVRLSAG
ncbi:hypothetical protein [Streptomyces sp. NPDC050504]